MPSFLYLANIEDDGKHRGRWTAMDVPFSHVMLLQRLDPFECRFPYVDFLGARACGAQGESGHRGWDSSTRIGAVGPRNRESEIEEFRFKFAPFAIRLHRRTIRR